MNVVKLVRPDPESLRTREILIELLALHDTGRLEACTYIAQIKGDRRQKFGALGRFEKEPQLALGAVGRLWAKLVQMVDADEADATRL